MAVLVFAESLTGSIKKPALEALTYGAQTANKLGTTCIAVTIGQADGADQLGSYGADQVIQIQGSNDFDSKTYAKAIAEVAEKNGADIIVFAHSSSGKSLAGRVAIRLDAGLVSAVTSLPENGFTVKKGVFSGKGFANYAITSAKKVVTIAGNTFRPEQSDKTAEMVTSDISLGQSSIKVIEQATVDGVVPLPEAELVVSAGRGMGMIH